ncbi:MAG: DNA polymerase III subunit alpha [Acutalibacteraceae bacterium]|nr:DNA polymerase III subunit alpha [Acutalibacteraceae bacterium]
MSFTHLHVHSEYSLLDGACRIEPMLDKIKSMGQTSVAITDHGVMYGVIDFYKAALAKGIKPVIGCEVYVAPRSRFDKVHGIDSERYHLVLLCKDNEGYKNLIKLVSEGWVNGFYTKPRVDKDILEKYHEGLIALSGCLAGEVAKALQQGDYDEAKRVALWYRDTFGEGNYYLEIQNHGLDEQLRINPELIRLSKELGIPLAATNDAHYVDKNDAKMQQVLICIQTNHTVGEDTGLEFGTSEFYLKSEDEMLESFPQCPEAVENTAIIAERCNVEFEFGKTKLPHFDVPEGYGHFEWFSHLCRKGLVERYGENPPAEYVDRLNYELEVINKMGYVDYYLIVHDFIRHAKEEGIPVGPGRGSGAASICAYCIGITGIDPMKYNLLFERFLNPERVSMPDFDVDFCYERRSEVIDYVIKKYGSDHVAQIVTFGTLAAKAAIRDVGRALGMPYSTVDNIAKQVPNELNITIERALKRSSEFKSLYENDDEARELIDMAKKVEGMPRHASTHAAGVVITYDPVVSYVPLARNDEAIVTQFPMTTLENLGLLKMDFLGLRTITVIKSAEKLIRKTVPDFCIDNVDMDDKAVFEMMCSAQTEGVFQFESAGVRSVLSQLKPESLEDLIAVISLYRPGPMDSIPTYIENRHNPHRITYKTPELKSILDVTYGCIVYQEQVMQICRELAGYSYGRADIVRRAMSKKKHDVMLRERDNFVYGIVDDNGNVICEGAVRRGIDEKTANEIFDEMMSFASYAFNKAHATAYAYVAYQTAWLKCHYPCEFLAALLTSFLDKTDKVVQYIGECFRLGIKILPPDINRSSESFEVSDGNIHFSLLAVKNLGRNFIKRMTAERDMNGRFVDFYDFCRRMYGKDFNRRAIESLVKCGAFDGLGANRNQLITVTDKIIEELDSEKNRNVEGQLGFGDLMSSSDVSVPSVAFTYPDVDEYPNETLLKYEKEVSGMYLSGHPMSRYRDVSEAHKCTKISDIISEGAAYKDNDRVKVLGLIGSLKRKITKNDSTMAFINLEDTYGSIEVIVFPKTLAENPSLLYEGNIVLLRGRISMREDEDTKIVCESVEPCPSENMVEKSKKTEKKKVRGLFLRFDNANSPQIEYCRRLLAIFDGNVPLFYYFSDSGEYKRNPLNMGIDVNPVLLRELRKILGDQNVIYNE